MSSHKKQHFVPKCYLKAWCDQHANKNETPYVWLFPKVGGTPRRKSPDNLFHGKDFYTVNQNDDKRDLRLEHGLSRFETKFCDVRRKLESGKHITDDDRDILCIFISAMTVRTKAYRDFQSEQWSRPLEMMESMIEWGKTATVEEKIRASTIRTLGKNNDSPKLYYEDVKRLVENPIPNILASYIKVTAPLLMQMDMLLMETKFKPGFITSDDPCVWYDPESHKRPALFQSPGLAYPTIEITLPISPGQLILLNRQGFNGTIILADMQVDVINARTRHYADEYVVVNENIFRNIWVKSGSSPNNI